MRVPRVRELLLKTSLMILVVVTGLLPQNGYASTRPLSVAVLSIDEQQMAVYSRLFDAFELRHPGVKVKVDFYNDRRYKELLPIWLKSGKYDVLYWQGGRRLKDLIGSEDLMPVSHLIDKQILTDFFHPGSLLDISDQGNIYAIPIGHYTWGFYYNRVLFEQLGLTEPNSWQAFLQVCEVLKQAGIPPLVQASKDSWPLLGWMDYLAFEAGGESLRRRIISSDFVSEQDASKVVDLFAPLISKDYFFAPDFDWDWSQTMGVLMRKQAAMTLMGQFAEGTIPSHMTEHIGFFSFPFSSLDKSVAVAPLELWVVPMSGGKREQVKLLLRFFSEKEVHQIFSLELGLLPVSKALSYGPLNSKRLQKGAELLHSSHRLIQYFDRDAHQAVSNRIARGMQNAIREAQPDFMRRTLTSQNTN